MWLPYQPNHQRPITTATHPKGTRSTKTQRPKPSLQVPFDTVVLPRYRVTHATVMTSPHPNLKVILIGGSSHVGKSTLSESLAATLGWTHLSTDSLARHPGLPWRPAPEKVPEHVAQHYLSLSVDDLIDDVLRHYKVNVWPKVEAIIASHTKDPSTTGIVVEGSALWPEFATNLDFQKTAAIWLTATEELFRQRIHTNSLYTSKTPRERKMIDKFLQRTLAYNIRMVEAVNRHGLNLVDVTHSNVTQLTKKCLSTLGINEL